VLHVVSGSIKGLSAARQPTGTRIRAMSVPYHERLAIANPQEPQAACKIAQVARRGRPSNLVSQRPYSNHRWQYSRRRQRLRDEPRSRLQEWEGSFVDLNSLLRRHQLSLIHGDCALTTDERQAHDQFAHDYAEHIRNARHALGARRALPGAVS